MEQRAIRGIVSAVIVLLLLGGPGRAREGEDLSRESLDAAYRPKRLGLVIGVNEFRDPKWRSLHFAVKDARDLSAALQDPELGGFDQVIELDDPWETTREAVTLAFSQLNNQNMGPDDVVIVYISTHGTLAHDPGGAIKQFMVTYDTEFDRVPETALSYDDLTALFNQLTSRRKVLIFASCHSGAGKSELPDDIKVELEHLKSDFFVRPIETASEASVIIGVCSFGETAQEDPGLQNDIYTHFFLEGMTKYDRNQDGAVSLSEAHDFAQRETYYYTKGQQRPFARSDILGSDPIILTGAVRDPGKPVIYSYEKKLNGAMVKLNGEEKGPLPDGFASEPGWTRVTAMNETTGEALFDGTIYVRDGERVELDRLVESRRAPNLGAIAAYRFMTSPDLTDEVIPNLPLYGMACRVGAFPTASSELRMETALGRSEWRYQPDSGVPRDVAATAIQANVALLYSFPANRVSYFAGPMIGVFGLMKEIEDVKGKEGRQSATVDPGIMAGVNVKVGRDVRVEISNRLTYNFFNVENEMKSSAAEEVAVTVYFSPRALLGK